MADEEVEKKGPKSILNKEEEEALETYMRKMEDYGHLLTIEELKGKVFLLTQGGQHPLRTEFLEIVGLCGSKTATLI